MSDPGPTITELPSSESEEEFYDAHEFSSTAKGVALEIDYLSNIDLSFSFLT